MALLLILLKNELLIFHSLVRSVNNIELYSYICFNVSIIPAFLCR